VPPPKVAKNVTVSPSGELDVTIRTFTVCPAVNATPVELVHEEANWAMEQVLALATPFTITVKVIGPPLLTVEPVVTVSGPSVPEQLTVALPFVVVVFGSLPVATSEVYSVVDEVLVKLAPVLPATNMKHGAGPVAPCIP
jgi:hypothetical protein